MTNLTYISKPLKQMITLLNEKIETTPKFRRKIRLRLLCRQALMQSNQRHSKTSVAQESHFANRMIKLYGRQMDGIKISFIWIQSDRNWFCLFTPKYRIFSSCVFRRLKAHQVRDRLSKRAQMDWQTKQSQQESAKIRKKWLKRNPSDKYGSWFTAGRWKNLMSHSLINSVWFQ